MKTLNKTIVNAKLFIIPNNIVDLSDEFYKEGNPLVEYLGTLEKDFNLENDGRWVRVWAHNENCENFSNYGEKTLQENWKGIMKGENYKFPSYLPVSLFEGKVEGDTVSIEALGTEVELELRQKIVRYERFGTFEETLKNLGA